MTSYFLMYLLVKLDDIKDFLYNYWPIGASIVLIFCYWLVMALFIDGDSTRTKKEKREDMEKLNRATGRKVKYILMPAIIINVIMVTISALLPTTKQACAILAGGAAANSAIVKSIADLDPKLAEYIKAKADEWLSDNLKVKITKPSTKNRSK